MRPRQRVREGGSQPIMLPAHFIWDLKCFLMAELKEPSHPALDAPCLSPSQIYSTRTMSAKQVWLMNVSPILNFYPNTLKSTYIIAYALKKKKTVFFTVPFCLQLHCMFFSNQWIYASSLGNKGSISPSPPCRWVFSWGRSSWGVTLTLGVLTAFPHTLPPPHFSCNVAESG